jgi:hypothetical protein
MLVLAAARRSVPCRCGVVCRCAGQASGCTRNSLLWHGASGREFSFGVMFFDDPAVALGNLRKALRRGGRLAFVCWRTRAENPTS